MSSSQLVAPFPYFGGKRTAATAVWEALGDVKSYVEPFCGSAAVLLARPDNHTGRREVVNDLDGFISNFWRAIKHDPDAVAEHCDWPINERDLAARHYWLVTEGRDRIAAMAGDPEAYCPQVAGWWVWGACAWIAGGWCSGDGPWSWDGTAWVKDGDGAGINHSMPHVGPSRGINRTRPHVGDLGQGINRQKIDVHQWFADLAARLRHVVVFNGDWKRAVGSPSVLGLVHFPPSGVFLDPPYSHDVRDKRIYTHDSADTAAEVRAWCLANGGNPQLRIVLAGYDNEGHAEPLLAAGWRPVTGHIKHSGGYGMRSGNKNVKRECLWLSPRCLGESAGLVEALARNREAREALGRSL